MRSKSILVILLPARLRRNIDDHQNSHEIGMSREKIRSIPENCAKSTPAWTQLENNVPVAASLNARMVRAGR